jgi:tryptophan synthase alpha chain
MNRINRLFEKKKENVLSVYFTAGYPEFTDTIPILLELEKNGVDMVEIGIPFSDPVADGPVIQASSQKALEKGMSLKDLFIQLENFRNFSEMPIVLMGYMNPVFRMGMENFVENCKRVGVDGVIIPDFPPEEYQKKYRTLFAENDIHNILLITPQTPQERIRELDQLSGGFVYIVSSYATTGTNDQFSREQLNYFRRIKQMKLKNPGMIGFGISNSSNFTTVCEHAAGGIIGSAFIRSLEGKSTLDKKIKIFIKEFNRQS